MIRAIAIAGSVVALACLAACAGGGSPTVRYGVGYSSYYGPSPWRYHPGHPVYIGGGRPDIPDIPDGPVATPLPDFGMPDAGGGMADFADFDF